MEIRLANIQDIPRLIDLLRQVGEIHHRGRPDLFRAGAQKYDEEALAALLADPDRPIFVAETDAVAGYAFCILKATQGDPVLRDRRTVYIDDLCVDEACRGQGIGEALYRAVCDYARRESFDSVTLNVWMFPGSALGFYEKMGLKPQKICMEQLLEEENAESQ